MVNPERPPLAQVIATYSRRMRLRQPDTQVVSARVKGKQLTPVCGDYVYSQPIPGESDWLITGIENRKNELSRPDAKGRPEILAANLDYVCVVIADPPAPDWFIVDRYLCSAELMHVAAAIVFNKIDRRMPTQDEQEILNDYAQIGYDTVRCSAKTGVGMDTLESLLRNRTAIVVGQSGVGKSSLINRLIESADQRTASVSASSGEGRHTTVNSAMLQLPAGGDVIDSPGVRDYAPATRDADDVISGFREVRDLGRNCKFANCRHLREPDCAVKQALDQGNFSSRRYESYKRLQNLTDKLARVRGPGHSPSR